MEELLKLHQWGSTEDCIERFKSLHSKLLTEIVFSLRWIFLNSFLRGLKPKLKEFVKTFKSQSLEDAFEYALHMDIVLDSQFNKLETVPKLSFWIKGEC
jgi:hypothetical protein